MKTLTKGLLSLLCIAALTACSDDDDPTPGPDSMHLYTTASTVDATAGELGVTIITNRSWTATPQSEWVKATPAAGAEKGIHEVTLSYEANPDNTPRECKILFAGGSYTVTYTLTQKAR